MKKTYQVDRSRVIGYCKIGTDGGKCTISKGETATRTINVALGASRGLVSGQLGISSSHSQTVTIGCESDPDGMKAGQVWRAYAVGDKFTYKVKKRETRYSNDGRVLSTNTSYSGLLWAFNPYSNGLFCE
ncbi:hypothetical protein [Microbacterium karelineae]|uniref:hypothetical protein n=1 Tax=Microbacterium karelineae TaxID=2654283 RepID=UPI0012EA8A7B|nr:hypothetical protein [Microbacterium karelineae]